MNKYKQEDKITDNDDENVQSTQQSEWFYFWAAIMFYTRLPTPQNVPHSNDILNKSRKYFPLIGIIVGAIGVLVYLICQLFLSQVVSVALSMVATILVTGAFHEDGFADSCDGLGGGWSKEQVLTIMKDSRVGTYAVVGLLSILGIKFLLLNELANLSISHFVFCYVAAHTTSRLVASLTIERSVYVQDIDQSKVKPVTDSRLNSQDLHATWIIAVFPILLCSMLALIPTLIATLAALISAKLFAAYSEKRIGGYTGDILGAIQQLSELSFYLVFVACL